jgi:hypothetical protein
MVRSSSWRLPPVRVAGDSSGSCRNGTAVGTASCHGRGPNAAGSARAASASATARAHAAHLAAGIGRSLPPSGVNVHTSRTRRASGRGDPLRAAIRAPRSNLIPRGGAWPVGAPLGVATDGHRLSLAEQSRKPVPGAGRRWGAGTAKRPPSRDLGTGSVPMPGRDGSIRSAGTGRRGRAERRHPSRRAGSPTCAPGGFRRRRALPAKRPGAGGSA